MGRRGSPPGRTVDERLWIHTEVVSWGPSVQFSQGLSLVTFCVTISFDFSENFDLTSRNRGWISQDPRKQDNRGLTRRRAGRSRSPDGLPTAR